MFFLTWRFSKRLEHYSTMKGPFHGGESDVKLGFALAGSKLTLVLVQDITMPTELSFAPCTDIVLFYLFIIIEFCFWKLIMTLFTTFTILITTRYYVGIP